MIPEQSPKEEKNERRLIPRAILRSENYLGGWELQILRAEGSMEFDLGKYSETQWGVKVIVACLVISSAYTLGSHPQHVSYSFTKSTLPDNQVNLVGPVKIEDVGDRQSGQTT